MSTKSISVDAARAAYPHLCLYATHELGKVNYKDPDNTLAYPIMLSSLFRHALNAGECLSVYEENRGAKLPASLIGFGHVLTAYAAAFGREIEDEIEIPSAIVERANQIVSAASPPSSDNTVERFCVDLEMSNGLTDAQRIEVAANIQAAVDHWKSNQGIGPEGDDTPYVVAATVEHLPVCAS